MLAVRPLAPLPLTKSRVCHYLAKVTAAPAAPSTIAVPRAIAVTSVFAAAKATSISQTCL